MMDVTGKLIDGVVSLTKLMAHGAMHEACLIEVIRSIEDEALLLVEDIRKCSYTNNTFNDEINNYIKENNATILDIPNKRAKETTGNGTLDLKDTKEMKELLRRMLADNKVQELDSSFKSKLLKLTDDIGTVDANQIEKNLKKD